MRLALEMLTAIIIGAVFFTLGLSWIPPERATPDLAPVFSPVNAPATICPQPVCPQPICPRPMCPELPTQVSAEPCPIDPVISDSTLLAPPASAPEAMSLDAFAAWSRTADPSLVEDTYEIIQNNQDILSDQLQDPDADVLALISDAEQRTAMDLEGLLPSETLDALYPHRTNR